jgi:esterase/lipase superfamily enzyme
MCSGGPDPVDKPNTTTGAKPPDGPLCCTKDDVFPLADPKIKGYVPVYFSTNRRVKSGVPFAVNSITYEPSEEATLGRVLVSVPIIHKLGQTEVPGTSFFGFKETPDAGKHFMVQSISKMTREQFVAAMANPADSLMLFVHGYNVSFTDAAFKSAQIAFDVHYQGRVLMYSWPSKGGMFDYDYDRESALVSSDALFDLLKLVKNEAKVSKIIVVAHSLGSEVLIGALQQAFLSGTKLGISELVFAASDVSANLYKLRGKQIVEAADKVTLYASSTDLALLASLKKSQTDTRMGYVLKSGPTIVKGVETIDVSAVGQDMFGLNHSTFSTSRAVIDDIGRIIVSGDHPPEKRIPSLELMPNKTNATYWMYPY